MKNIFSYIFRDKVRSCWVVYGDTVILDADWYYESSLNWEEVEEFVHASTGCKYMMYSDDSETVLIWSESSKFYCDL